MRDNTPLLAVRIRKDGAEMSRAYFEGELKLEEYRILRPRTVPLSRKLARYSITSGSCTGTKMRWSEKRV